MMKPSLRILLLPVVIIILASSLPIRVPAQNDVPLWVNRFSSQGDGFDESAKAVAVDTSGRVFVTGQVSSNLNSDFATIAYANNGTSLWTNFYQGLPSNSYDGAIAIAVGSNGNVFVTGFSRAVSGQDDYATVAYSGEGIPIWTNRFNGIGNQRDRPTAIKVDSAGNVIVTGYSDNTNQWEYNHADYLTIKYSDAGVPAWTNRYNGPGLDGDSPTALVVDGSGNVYVTGGSSGGPVTQGDIATIKYSGSGTALWTNRYNGSSYYDDYANAIALDGNGNLFVTGGSRIGTNSFDFATIKLSSAGKPAWTNTYNGGNHFYNDDVALAIATDDAGNVFVTGYSTGNLSGTDFATIMYSNGGIPQWTNRYNGPANSTDSANCIASDGKGNVIVAGTSAGAVNNGDYCLIGYSKAGVATTTNRYASGSELLTGMALDAGGNVFVTGRSSASGTSYDYATLKYFFNAQPIPLASKVTSNRLVLCWSDAAFALQSSADSMGVFTNIAGATSPHTNSITGSSRFFRLKID